MKTTKLLLLGLLATGAIRAQTWSQNFNTTAVPGLPAGWSQANLDGLTPFSGVQAQFQFGNSAWVTFNDPTLGRVVVSTSYYSPAGVANDWLITPSFTVPANAFIEWDAAAGSANWPESYQVRVSTNGTATANFTTTIFNVAPENTTLTQHMVSLGTFSNQTVNVAFVNNTNDGTILILDNMRVFVPPANDGAVESLTGVTRYTGLASVPVGGVFKSLGLNAANSAVLNYAVNNGPVVTQTVAFNPALNLGQTSNFAFTTNANLALGRNKLKVWLSAVNGVPETNLLNDTARTEIFRASQTVNRNVLIEEWSSSTCPPCAALNVGAGFNALLNNNNPNTGGRVNVIKYQMNWPNPNNDPSFNAHGNARRNFYDVQGVPYSMVNGKVEMQNHNQAEIDAGKNVPAYANIVATLSATGSTNTAASPTVVGSATITPYVNITSNSPVRVYQAMVQAAYHYTNCTTCAAANGNQREYYHIMRKMNPNGAGSPTVLTDGTAFTVNFSLNPSAADINPTPAQNSYNFWISGSGSTPEFPKNANEIVYEYVVFLQDTVSKDVLQSSSWTATVAIPTTTTTTVSTVGLLNQFTDVSLSVYPSPASDYAAVSLKLEQAAKVKLTVSDLTGRVVYENPLAEVPSGENTLNIDTREFASGTYLLVVQVNDAVLKEKLVISK